MSALFVVQRLIRLLAPLSAFPKITLKARACRAMAAEEGAYVNEYSTWPTLSGKSGTSALVSYFTPLTKACVVCAAALFE